MLDFSGKDPNEVFAMLMVGLFVFSCVSALMIDAIITRRPAKRDEILKIRQYITEAVKFGDKGYQNIIKDIAGECYRKQVITNGDIEKIKKIRNHYFRE